MSIMTGSDICHVERRRDMAENDEILMTNDEAMSKLERTNGKHRHPERIPPSREKSKDPAMEA